MSHVRRIGMMRLLLVFMFMCRRISVSVVAASTLTNTSSAVQMVSTLGPVMTTSANFNILKIGAPISFTSQESVYFNQSTNLYNGWKLFVKWVNVGWSNIQGGTSGVVIGNETFSVELAVIEDYSTPALAAQAAEWLVHGSVERRVSKDNYSADFLFGPYSSPLTTATVNVTDSANVLLLSASSLHAAEKPCNSTLEKESLLLALQPPPSTFAHSLFQTLNWLGAHTVAIVVDDVADSYCMSAPDMQALADLYNVTLYGFYSVEGGDTDEEYSASLHTILSSLQASSSVDVVAGCPQRELGGNPYLQSSGRSVCVQLPLVAKNLSYSPSGLLFVNCDFEDPASVLALGTAAAYLLSLVPWHPSPLILEEEGGSISGGGWSAEDFYLRYLAQFQTPPTYHAAAAFASGTVLQTVLKGLTPPQTATYNDGRQLANILKANGTYFPTIFGNVSFTECGESAMSLLVLQGQARDGHAYEQGREGARLQSAVVFPPQYAAPSNSSSSSLLVYPAPSWATRNCEEATNHCSGHGTCTEAMEGQAACECNPGYYGLQDPLSCDTFCEGELRDDFCIESQTFHIGGTYAGLFVEHAEHIAHFRHAIDLINNKTDGWFDSETPQVHIVLQLEDSGCDADEAEISLQKLQNWAVGEGSALTAIVGAFCSGASMAVATQANIQDFFQISYASTNEGLSDVDQYRYFARTAASDAIQGPLLAKSLIELGATPFMAVLHLTDSYSSSLAKAVIQTYEESGDFFVLLTAPFDGDEATDADYQDIVFRAGESGAAIILFVGYQDIAVKIFEAAAMHPVLGSSQVLWVGVDAWTGLELQDTNLLPLGTIGITPQVAHNPVTQDYLRRWAALNPQEFPSLSEESGGSREVLATYSSTLVDATLALSKALQHAVEGQLDLTGASLFNELTANVYFEGVSGTVNFDTAGDLLYPTFSLSNYRSPLEGGGSGEGEWLVVGNVTETSFFTDSSLLQWPGGASNASSFSHQLIPWCLAGSEPLLTFATGIYTCSPCKVGFYKSADGRSLCQTCPEGAQCDDTGIAVPCIKYGYWRDPTAEQYDIGDFSAFSIYRCEVHDVCHGGCVLNSSCASDRQRLSPVCGVCAVNMYMSDHRCYSCAAESMDNKTFRLFVYLLATLGLIIFLVLILFANLVVTPTMPKKKSSAGRGSRGRADETEDVFISEQLIHDMMGSKGVWGGMRTQMQDSPVVCGEEEEQQQQGDGVDGAGKENENEMIEVEMVDTNQSALSRVRSTSVEAERGRSSLWNRDRSMSRLVFIDVILKNKNSFKKIIRGGSITGKITISFLQVLTGSFLALNLKYPNYLRQFFVDVQINPFQPVESTFKCADQNNIDDDISDQNTEQDVYFLSIFISVLCPVFFLVILVLAVLIARFAYFKLIYPTKRPRIENRNHFLMRQFSKTYNLSIKLYIWFCLIMYPVLSANIIGVFNCRDLGDHTGIFLRGDYTLNCESHTYRMTRKMAIVGILFIPVGVPLFFAVLIYHRDIPWLKQPSFFLHGNFIPRWRYFEVLDLLRKLALTSIAQYIGEVDSTSQCLFLLVVDTASLVLLSLCKPYQNSRDDFLALMLVTTECAAFLFGVVVLAGIDEEDNYPTDALYGCLFAWFVVDLVVFVPLSLAAKSHTVTKSLHSTRARCVAAVRALCESPRRLMVLLRPQESALHRTAAASASSKDRDFSAENPLHLAHT